MKAVFSLYHDMAFQSRPQECIAALKLMGVDDIVLVTIAPWKDCPPGVRVVEVRQKDFRRYPAFYRTSLRTIRREKPDIVMLHDNFTSPILRKLKKQRFKGSIIYDSSELYIDPPKIKNLKYFIYGFIPKCEKKYLRLADVVIAANRERADIMTGYFKLDKTPVVLENMRRIALQPDTALCDEKYGALFSDGTFRVLFGGGVKHTRRAAELAEAVISAGDDTRLIIAGGSEPGELSKLEELMAKIPDGRIVYLGQVPKPEWRYLITRSDVCVSIYLTDTNNNRYCASGRFYEGIFEGVPALCSENPPLKNACERYGFGVASEDLREGLIRLRGNYAEYKRNAEKFARECRYEDRIPELARNIEERLSHN